MCDMEIYIIPIFGVLFLLIYFLNKGLQNCFEIFEIQRRVNKQHTKQIEELYSLTINNALSSSGVSTEATSRPYYRPPEPPRECYYQAFPGSPKKPKSYECRRCETNPCKKASI